MKDRKMQMRGVGTAQQKMTNFTGTVFTEPTKMVGYGNFGNTSRPVSRESRLRHQQHGHPINK